jgi:hypothetical protein
MGLSYFSKNEHQAGFVLKNVGRSNTITKALAETLPFVYRLGFA